ncbi:MAG TPA: hypothetical protein VMT46_00590 [Anaerolineaceae bacterium]|nr:hypothetical protein [Anaerolineaceae bacterium]
MNHRLLGWLAATSLVTTVVWLVLLIAGISAAGPQQSFEQVLSYVSRMPPLYTLTYANAALTVIAATALFGGLYRYLQPTAPEWAAIGVVFVPIYAALSLVVYLSQISLVPNLVALSRSPETQAQAIFFLRQTVQQWPGSALFFLDNLAYAILGIPSIIFGLHLRAANPRLKIAGYLLAANGIACILGVIGLLFNLTGLNQGSLVGGFFYVAALIPLTWILLARGPAFRSNGKEPQRQHSRPGQTTKK